MPLARIRFEYLADYRTKAFLNRPSLQLLTGDDLRYQASGMPIRPLVAARLELLLGLIHSGRTASGT